MVEILIVNKNVIMFSIPKRNLSVFYRHVSQISIPNPVIISKITVVLTAVSVDVMM